MRHFRTNHLKPAHLALVPEKGYDSCGDNQSDLALNFMQWYADKYGVHIQNAFSAEGEKRRCWPADKPMKTKFSEYTGDGGPIDIRSCFMGGRTGALKLYHKAAKHEQISYYDFTSLYPYINYVTDYPIGHPTLHVPCEDVDCRRPEDNPYPLAILKVFVIPPRRIDVPVLPVKVDDRLCFPLCMKCCKKFPNGGVKEAYSCTHNDRERGWISTCTSLEGVVFLTAGNYGLLARTLMATDDPVGVVRTNRVPGATKKSDVTGLDMLSAPTERNLIS
ncbi:hypothetical protein niasHT_024788 [Heterodera trifolii]|uniref:DNA-directed DNA polymerase n=1 Tax=Heterodera trifolii TaxID=157864 RepID=A0ABD2KFF1_9BILA